MPIGTVYVEAAYTELLAKADHQVSVFKLLEKLP
jgi:hypothetical protein